MNLYTLWLLLATLARFCSGKNGALRWSILVGKQKHKVQKPKFHADGRWSCCAGNLLQPIRNTTQNWVVTRHQYGISALVSQTSFHGESSGGVAKCWLFS